MLLLILLIHLFFLINTKFTLWPEMVVYPFLLNNNFLLYRDIINPYPPFLTFFLKFFAIVFGYNPLPYQILTWGVILITDIIIFIISKEIYKKNNYAILSLIFFVIMSVSFSINGLWFDLIQTPFILIAFYYFYTFVTKKVARGNYLFFSAIFLSVAFYIKQQVIWIGILFAILFLQKFGKMSWSILKKNFLLLVAPFSILLIFQVFFFWQKNTLDDFLFWTFYFPFFKAGRMPGYVDFPTLRQLLVVGILFLVFIPTVLKRNWQTTLIISTGLIMILFAYPRFDYFHLIPSLGVLSLAFGANLKILSKSKTLIRAVFIFSLFLLFSFAIRYLINNTTSEIRFFEKDIIQAASFLKIVTTVDEPLYIQNGPDQLLPIAKRLPLKPWIDEFPWYLELDNLQDRVVSAFITQNPKFVIYKPYNNGRQFDLGSYKPQKIVFYIESNYQESLQISDTLWLKIRR